jgi:hypothetical protein
MLKVSTRIFDAAFNCNYVFVFYSFVAETRATRKNSSLQWDHPLTGYHLVQRMLGWYRVADELVGILDSEHVESKFKGHNQANVFHCVFG